MGESKGAMVEAAVARGISGVLAREGERENGNRAGAAVGQAKWGTIAKCRRC